MPLTPEQEQSLVDLLAVYPVRKGWDTSSIVLGYAAGCGLPIVHVGIYSASAMQLTSVGHQECNVDGPSATGNSYEDAGTPSYRWMFDRLFRGDERGGVTRCGPPTRSSSRRGSTTCASG